MKRKIHILGSGNAAKRHREAIERFPLVYTETSYEEADIIDCCGIPGNNLDRARLAMIGGKDVILEKPFATSLGGMHSFVALELMFDRRVYPVLNYRCVEHLPIDDCICWERDTSYYEGWRGETKSAFGGVIMSHGIHFIDEVIRSYGKVGSVYCATSSNPDYRCEVETAASITLGFASGHTQELYFLIDNIHPTTAPPNPGWDHFFKDLDSAPRLKELYHLQAVIDACYQSAQEERWVTVS